MKLDKGVKGATYRVASLDELPVATARRLESLGMTPGILVDVLNTKSRGCAVVRLRKTRYALGRGLTSRIKVEPASNTTEAEVVRHGQDA
jgi:ferrous iron transport protein A